MQKSDETLARGRMTNLTKEAPSLNRRPGWRIGHWVIWKFFSHYGLGLGH
jgi:hypothetical protein